MPETALEPPRLFTVYPVLLSIHSPLPYEEVDHTWTRVESYGITDVSHDTHVPLTEALLKFDPNPSSISTRYHFSSTQI